MLKESSSRPWRLAALVMAIAAFVLGVVGFLEAGSTSVLHAIYSTIGLYTLGFSIPAGATAGSLPVSLELARFLAPAATMLAIVQVLAALFREQVDALGARRQRHHVVICGLGPVGIATAIRMRAQGRSVVAIERDASCPRIRTARSHGVRVVVGEATSRAVRARAAITRAGWLVWTPSEWLEGEAVAEELRADLQNARDQRRIGPEEENAIPSALIRVRDLGLCSMFRRDVLINAGTETDGNLDTDFFNEAENTAQRLLWKTTRGFALSDGSPLELWILGGGPFVEALVVQAVRNWWGSHTRPPLVIRLFDDDAEETAARLVARWPEVAQVDVVRAQPGPPDIALARALGPDPVPDGIYILVADEERALQLGLQLLEEVECPHVAVAATRRYPSATADPRVVFFDSVDFGLESDAFMFDTFELLGRMIHQHSVLRPRLLDDDRHDHEADPDGPAHEWNDLRPVWRASSRAAAREIVPTLRSIGFRIARLGTGGADPDPAVEFTTAQVEAMAEREHERWRTFMLERGWRPGAERDNRACVHPSLVAWADAPPRDRQATRDQVAEYARLLAFLGFAVVSA